MWIKIAHAELRTVFGAVCNPSSASDVCMALNKLHGLCNYISKLHFLLLYETSGESHRVFVRI